MVRGAIAFLLGVLLTLAAPAAVARAPSEGTLVFFKADRSSPPPHQGSWQAVRPDGSGMADFSALSPEPQETSDWTDDGARLLYGTGSGLESRARRGGRRVTYAVAPDRHVVVGGWSPDGRSVAFSTIGTAANPAAEGIQTAAADGSGARTIPGTTDLLFQTWESDSRHLLVLRGAFRADAECATYGIWRVDSADGARTQLVSGVYVSEVAGSPDGRWIGYITPGIEGPCSSPEDQLWIVDAKGQGARRIAKAYLSIEWSPDSSRLLYQSSLRDWRVVNRDGSGRRKVLPKCFCLFSDWLPIALPASPRDGGPGSARCAGRRATKLGTGGADTLNGTNRRDVIAALGGNDVVRGLSGNDLICGGRGRDKLIGGRGRDTLRGQAGRDKLIGGPGRDKRLQ